MLYLIKKTYICNMYSSNIISTKGSLPLVNEVEVRRNGFNEGFFMHKKNNYE
jgi:hypothetical protein